VRNGVPVDGGLDGALPIAGSLGGSFLAQPASSFGNLARLQAAIANDLPPERPLVITRVCRFVPCLLFLDHS